MFRNVICFLLLLHAKASLAQPVQFIFPLKGTLGRDFYIESYPDHDTGKSIRDVFCGRLSYDGHLGTDIVLRGYDVMDSGVQVIAAAAGIVVATYDGEYDRQKRRIDGTGFGNHVVIRHKNNIRTYYAHMKKSSIMVHIGDTIEAGQPLGLVGSSGYSNFPHLHFEPRNEKGQSIDPYSGPCGRPGTSWWQNQPLPDTAVYAIDKGFVPYVPGLDTLQERYLVSDTLDIMKNSKVCFWVRTHGLRPADRLRAEWYTPGNKLWYEYNYDWHRQRLCDYTWTWIDMPPGTGKWLVMLYVNDKFFTQKNFYLTRQKSSHRN